MRLLIIAFLPGCIALLGAVCVVTHAKLLHLLRKKHTAAWSTLGQPALFSSRMYYQLWLLRGGYNSLKDPEISALGSKLTGASVLAALLLVAWLACASLSGYVKWG